MSRFTTDSFQKESSVMAENLGIMSQYISKVLRTEKIIRLGESVCRVVVKGICTGTGFVLFDNFIMTNAHLFKTCSEGGKVRMGTEVEVQFNYGVPQIKYYLWFRVEDALICYSEGELDYAVLVVNAQALAQSGVQFPSGLLERVGEMPENGDISIIGHPEGKGKQIDLTSTVEIENRKQAVLDILKYKDQLYSHFVDQLKSQGIERILMGGDKAEEVLTYRSFMYHGASGSPVFDVDGFLCGLHTGGYFIGPREAQEHVLEFAYPMKTIITHLVKTLFEKNLTELLKRMKNVAENNDVLREIFDSIDQLDEPMEQYPQFAALS